MPAELLPHHEAEFIREHGPTNSAWMRYRLSGELPAEAEFIVAIRTREQMAPLGKFPRKEPQIIIDFSNYKKASAGIMKLLKRAENRDLPGNDLENLSTSLATYTHDYPPIGHCKSRQRISVIRRVPAWKDRIMKVVKSDKRSANERAHAVSILFQLEKFEDSDTIHSPSHPINQALMQALMQEDYDLLDSIISLKDKHTARFSVMYLKNEYGSRDAKEPSLVLEERLTRFHTKFAVALLPSLVTYARADINPEDSWGSVTTTENCRFIANLSDGVLANTKTQEELSKKGFDFSSSADGYMQYCMSFLTHNSAHDFTHKAMDNMLRMINNLYKLGNKLPEVSPEKTYAFLKALHKAKIDTFSEKYATELRKLAETMGLDYEKIRIIER